MGFAARWASWLRSLRISGALLSAGVVIWSRLGFGHDGDALELEPEIADPREQSVEVCLVDDLANELGVAVAAYKRHALEGRREAVAQRSADADPDPLSRLHR